MANSYFAFKKFVVEQEHAAMKVTTDACLFGAWVANELHGYATSATQVLDIGSGTGLLALIIAQQIDGTIDAIEIDKETAKEAKKNVTCSPWSKKINIINGDARNCIPSNKKYDFIISNPPFYEKELNGPTAKKNIAHHDSGLRLSELFEAITNHLQSDGSFYIMLPQKRIHDILELIEAHKFFVKTFVSVRQSPVHEVFRIFIHGKTIQAHSKTEQKTLIIRNEKQEYTAEFCQLLKDYYLNL